ncbi:nucleotidyltransferase substrate binding protein [Aquibacillus sp. 3ASR75-11]|uniref:Nucleotidyltransferase substrate binding protein n=1 Tax=Terrihalobacillus insolitus TaxID=2950438 RepID=A0A9X3WPV6_9BACI|nr:HI0074 family nucleotidyltransferase substrate-binding subunit [Terrihalobacillus insolitus]MDC3412307.1 nucleotidyltransferase substrate binding protein [Terrihalobacillus insolitus]MDC3423000.1 nucleotidyltransferase substrate binding protein [Terrihalobacillus insolitus]
MERIQERLRSAEKALGSLQELVLIDQPNEVERDALIQRFKFTFEACWKAAKQYLYDVEGVDVGSPKGVIRSCREINMFNEEETILGLYMVNDRNLTVHTYNEEVAIKIQSNINSYFSLMSNWIQKMRTRI